MIAKILKILLIFTGVLSFSACSTKTHYVDRVQKVNVPTKCLIPKVECEFSGTYTETVKKMWFCIEDLREASKVCQ